MSDADQPEDPSIDRRMREHAQAGPGAVEDARIKAELHARIFGSRRQVQMLGRYELRRRIGRGGMGSVYEAFDPVVGRRVAVKTVAFHSSSAHVRLWREAKSMARIEHPNIVAVLDIGATDDTMYVVMDFVDGTTARQFMAHAHPWPHSLSVFLQIADGLCATHALGIIHRDIKPENVLIERSGVAKLVDFGLAKALPGTPAEDITGMGEQITKTGATLGTVGYMSPEQITGRPVDARADQFSYCAMLYEALFGAAPFDGQSSVLVGMAIVRGNVNPPPRVTSVPEPVRDAIMRGLRPNPNDRFPNMVSLTTVLRQALLDVSPPKAHR